MVFDRGYIRWLADVVLFEVHEVIIAIAVSLPAGGILLNVFKDDLQVGTVKNYMAFLGGAVVIALLFMPVKG